jgi:hypothetical protein
VFDQASYFRTLAVVWIKGTNDMYIFDDSQQFWLSVCLWLS